MLIFLAIIKTYLVIPRPGTTQTLSQQTEKVIMPFSKGLWGLVIGIIFAAALLSVWFTDSVRNARTNDRRESMQANMKRRKMAYVRLTMDSFLEKGLFFCSAGVEQDGSTSLPNKILLFGFGFFILISVSAYVANLAAFLTLNSAEYVRTMEEAVAAKYKICAHPAIQTELEVGWPDAIFYFHKDANEFPGMLDDYLAGKCNALVVGHEDTSMDAGFLERLCEIDLVYTESVVAEIPQAFPIRSDIASGFSYWMYQGERRGVTLQTAKDEFAQDISCNVRISAEEDTQGSEYDEITIKNMFFPIMFFTSCATLAVLLQIKHQYNESKGKTSALGRKSTLNLVSESTGRKQSLSFGKRGQKLSFGSKDNEDDVFIQDGAMMRKYGEDKEEEKEDGGEEMITPTSFMAGVADEGRRKVRFGLDGDAPRHNGGHSVRFSLNDGATG
uniref:Ionotropic glutamate receptor C-terminal domain-containing protein n=1 Tax=Odontella aurita TaxID=265563 RepID=A0A6U6GMI0_9STRA|mmetsp:Transcript_42527/g.129034  ORF Transcript_42527/g.129034 Transcript_42527/m.129034 type:complete len:443 (+) Transcript_42527:963-2291(+)